jgi:hypothetical protein
MDPNDDKDSATAPASPSQENVANPLAEAVVINTPVSRKMSSKGKQSPKLKTSEQMSGTSVFDSDAIIKRLEALKDLEFDRMASELRRLVMPKVAQSVVDTGNSLLFWKILEDGSQVDDVRFAAFHGLVHYLRRTHQVTKLNRLIVDYESLFSTRLTYQFFASAYVDATTRSDFEIAIRTTGRYLELNSDSAAVAHAHAAVVLRAVNSGTIPESERLKLSQDGIEAAFLALSIRRNHPRYQATLGGLLTVAKRFSEARRYLEAAIASEDPTLPDYSARVQEYSTLLLLVSSAAVADEVERNVRVSKASLETLISEHTEQQTKERIRSIEVLAIFVALTTLLVAGLPVATRSIVAEQGSGALLTMVGSIFALLFGLAIILPESRRMRVLGPLGFLAAAFVFHDIITLVVSDWLS